MTQRGRGAVRSEAAHLAILRAAGTLVEDVGYDRVTIEGIAAGAGVAKQTIYRWYASKSAVIAEAMMEGHLATKSFTMPDTGRLIEDLASWLDPIFFYLAEEKHAALIGSLVSAAVQEPAINSQLAERLGATAPPFAQRIARAVESGDLRPEATPQLLGQAIFGVTMIRIINRTPYMKGEALELVRFLVGHEAMTSQAQ